MITEKQALATLRRIPDRIVLAIMGRDLDLGDSCRCVCGWAVREKLAEIRDARASTINLWDEDGFDLPGDIVRRVCSEEFGGTRMEWDAIYAGVIGVADLPVIETAFTRRVEEAVFPQRKRARAL